LSIRLSIDSDELSDFYDNQWVIVDALNRRNGVRPGLDVAGAADILRAINHPDVWLLLVRQRGWTPEQFEQWLGDTTCEQLLGRPARRKPRGGRR